MTSLFKPNFIFYLFILLTNFFNFLFVKSCDTPFNGFGVHLGAIAHFNRTNEKTVDTVINQVYSQLKIRHFRTSYESYFSHSPHKYDLTCSPDGLLYGECTWAWEYILKTLSNKSKYSNISLIASVWSPPLYMKDTESVTLKPSQERNFYYYIKNITELINGKYGLDVDKVSIVNEPENVFAPWEHTNMDPLQLCSIVQRFDDPLIELCPENSYFWISQIFLNYLNEAQAVNCSAACKTVASHAYALNIVSSSPDFGKAYYDQAAYPPIKNAPKIWMTEVSSTFSNAEGKQMSEGLALAKNIINFLGVTCVERYYFWSSFTDYPSGESLIWGSGPGESSNDSFALTFPKKYFIFNQFTNGSHLSPGTKLKTCSDEGFNLVPTPALCLIFSPNYVVFLNEGDFETQIYSRADCSCGLCCTTEDSDFECLKNSGILPRKSVCTCRGGCGGEVSGGISSKKYSSLSMSKKLKEKITYALLSFLSYDAMAHVFF